MQISFTVPGRPVPMARPRVTSRGTYTPKRCRNYKTAVALAAKTAMKGKKPLTGAVMVDLKIAFAVPKSWSKAKQKAALGLESRPISRNSGDADNHAKAIMDACTGIVWEDDSQVVNLHVTKWYKEDCAIVTISSVDEVKK